MDTFTQHCVNQVLRFSRAESWESLSKDRQLQLAFNLGGSATQMELSKKDSYDLLMAVQGGQMSLKEFHDTMKRAYGMRGWHGDEEKVMKSF
jgi:hypothetical protein